MRRNHITFKFEICSEEIGGDVSSEQWHVGFEQSGVLEIFIGEVVMAFFHLHEQVESVNLDETV